MQKVLLVDAGDVALLCVVPLRALSGATITVAGERRGKTGPSFITYHVYVCVSE